MELRKDMVFDVTDKFIPNFFRAKTVQIIAMDDTFVRIQFCETTGTGGFPIEQFRMLVTTGVLIPKENRRLQEMMHNEKLDTSVAT